MRFLKIAYFYFCLLLCLLMFGCSDSTDSTPKQHEEEYTLKNNNTANSTQQEQATQEEIIPQDVEKYHDSYYKHLHKWEIFWQDSQTLTETEKTEKQNEQNKEALELDKNFVQLRQKYLHNAYVMKNLESYQCFFADCSAIMQDDEYFYPNTTILDAYYMIMMDKNTKIFSDVNIIKEYDYVLKNMQTTTIDLQSQAALLNQPTQPYRSLKFEWTDSKHLTITLSPREEICLPYQYNSITMFIQDSAGVRTKRYVEKLPTFSYPADLVLFVAQSCACARALGNIPMITREDLSELDKKSLLQPNVQYCEEIDSKRKELWEKYMQDSRIIGILQHEQKMYRAEYNKDLLQDNEATNTTDEKQQ